MSINILFCSNDKYATKLAVGLSSLLERNKELLEELNIIVRTNDMKEKTVFSLCDIAKRYGLNDNQIHFSYTNKLCERLEREHVEKFKNSYLCYFKLFGLNELQDELDRLLVIDCDVIVKSSIKELYEFKLGQKAVASVREFPANHTRHEGRVLGEYNTGVILYDMKKYVSLEIEKKLKDYMKEIPPKEWKTGDQTVFTLCMERYDLVETLPLKYNFIINQLFFTYKDFAFIRDIKNNYYSEKQYKEAKENPCILHLISGDFIISPWFYEGDKTLKREWDRYIQSTDWREKTNEVYQKVGVKKLLRHYALIFIYYFLPKRISLTIIRTLYRRLG